MLQHVGNGVTRRIVKHICSCSTLMRSHSPVFLHQTLHTCYTAVCYCCCGTSTASLLRQCLAPTWQFRAAFRHAHGFRTVDVLQLGMELNSPRAPVSDKRIISPETMFLHGSSFSLESVLPNVAFRTTCDTALLVRKIEWRWMGPIYIYISVLHDVIGSYLFISLCTQGIIKKTAPVWSLRINDFLLRKQQQLNTRNAKLSRDCFRNLLGFLVKENDLTAHIFTAVS